MGHPALVVMGLSASYDFFETDRTTFWTGHIFDGNLAFAKDEYYDMDDMAWYADIHKWRLDSSGHLVAEGTLTNSLELDMFISGGLLMTISNQVNFRDPDDFLMLDQADIGAVDSLVASGDRVCWLGPGGLGVLDCSGIMAMRPARVFHFDPLNFVHSYHADVSGPSWMSMRSGNGQFVTYDYSFFSLENPLDPISLSSGQGHDGYDWGIFSISLLDDNWYLTSFYEFEYNARNLEIHSISTGSMIFTIDDHGPGELNGWAYYDQVFWTVEWSFGAGTNVIGHIINNDGTVDDPFILYNGNGTVVGGRRNFACLQVGGELEVYDFSDLDSVRLKKVVSLPGPKLVDGIWVGEVFWFFQDQNVYSIDFKEELPSLLHAISISSNISHMGIKGDTLILEYQTTNPTEHLWQLFEIQGDGVAVVASPPVPGYLNGRFAMRGNRLVLHDGYQLKSYDISDPSDPVLVGVRKTAASEVAIRDGYVIAGNRVFPLDCGFADPPIQVQAIALQDGDPGPVDCTSPPHKLTVALMTTPDFDATRIDNESVTLGPGQAREIHADEFGMLRHVVDFDRDGDLDLVMHFRAADTGLDCTATGALLQGETFTGVPITADVTMADPWRRAKAGPSAGAMELHPNPFNATLVIDFTMTNRGHASVEVFDLRGRVVARLLDGERGAGQQSITWNGRNDAGVPVPSGSYYVRMVTPAGVHTEKCALLK